MSYSAKRCASTTRTLWGARVDLRHLIPRALVAAACVALLQLMAGGLIESANRGLYDSTLRWQSHRQPTDDTPYVLVEIDDASIESLGRFPWGRGRFAELLDRTREGRARVVGIDVLFSEAADAAGDESLREAIAAAGNVVLASAAALASTGEYDEEPGNFGQLRPAERMLEPLPSLAEVAAGIGSISVLEDTDGTMRRYPAMIRYLDAPYQSMAQVMAGLSTSDEDLTVTLERDGSLLINYGSLSPAAIARISFVDVLGLDRADALRLFSDKIVIVAATYTGGVDVAPTPLAVRTPASYAHVFALNTLITGRVLVLLPPWVPFLFALVIIGILGTQLRGQHPLRGLGVAGTLVTILMAGSAILFLLGRIILLPALPILTTFVFVAGYGVQQWWTNLSARRQAEAVLERFLGAKIRRVRLADSESEVHAQAVQLTILSVRIAEFESLTRDLDPKMVADIVRSFHSETVEVVESGGGTIDRVVGDGLIAYWGYPESFSDQASRAVVAALEIKARMKSLGSRLEEMGLSRIHSRLGIATGTAVLADVGSDALADFTILGGHVSLADRLRETAPLDGVHLCQWTHDLAQSALPHPAFEQPAFTMEGFSEPVRSYLVERPYRAWVRREPRIQNEAGE